MDLGVGGCKKCRVQSQPAATSLYMENFNEKTFSNFLKEVSKGEKRLRWLPTLNETRQLQEFGGEEGAEEDCSYCLQTHFSLDPDKA